MNISQWHNTLPPDLTRALNRFEAQFTYPLGPDRHFRISHGDDYQRFFRAMGEAACFVAHRGGEVVGAVGAAIRELATPDGAVRRVLYVGDLKIAPEARNGHTLPRLLGAVERWARPQVSAAFGIVMNGTHGTPDRYTGRSGIAAFHALADVAVLRLDTGTAPAAGTAEWIASSEDGVHTSRHLGRGRYACRGGDPLERSACAPMWLVAPDRTACGRLEDTRLAKRLYADDGAEMCSAHLSEFAYGDPDPAARLLQVAMIAAAGRGFPTLFVATRMEDAAAIVSRLGEGAASAVIASATIFGHGLEENVTWNINTAEI